MTTDARQRTRTPAAPAAEAATPPQGGAAADAPPAPAAAPDFSLLFQDGAELPDDLKPLAPVKDSLRSFFETKIGEAATQAQQEAADRMRQQQEAERTRTQSQAQIQENISWAQAIEADLFSGDATKAAEAKAKRDAEPNRYTDAMAAKFSMARQQVARQVQEEFLDGAFRDVAANGGQAIIDAMTPEVLQQNGYNPLRTIAALARQQGEQAGYERGLAEGEQRATVSNGSGGPQAQTPARPAPQTGSITEGVSLGKPGSTRQLMANYRAKQNRN